MVINVPQLSLFSADARTGGVADLAGLLCGPGQVVRFGDGATARLSIVLADDRRADALLAECAQRDVPAELVDTPTGATVLRTAFRADLVALAGSWARGAVKAVPPGFELDGASLRIWLLGAGVDAGAIALDPQAPGTHAALQAAVARAGLTGTVHHGRGGRPVLRFAGNRRCAPGWPSWSARYRPGSIPADGRQTDRPSADRPSADHRRADRQYLLRRLDRVATLPLGNRV